MNERCEYPDCDCDLECKVTGLRLDYYDEEPPLRQRTIRERAVDVMRPGLGMIAVLWGWLRGGRR